jgi:hypothetical protein
MTQSATQPGQAVAQATRRAEGAARQASPGIIWAGRLGFACKGLVYLLIGVLAAQAALGRGGATTDSQGVLVRVVEAPFGKVLLGLVAVGLAGFVVWRLMQAILDTDNQGTDASGAWARAGYLVSGVVYASLALSALRLLQGNGGPRGGDQAAQDWTALLLDKPFGPVLVAAVGLGVLGSAAFQAMRAYKADFRKDLRSAELSPAERDFATGAGRLGHAARAVTFGLIGVFLIGASIHQEPAEARGLAGALGTLVEQPYGPYLLLIVAAGLVAYGLYMFVEARYRRMVV